MPTTGNEFSSHCPNYLAVGKALCVLLPNALRCHIESKMREFQQKLINKFRTTPCTCTPRTEKHRCQWATELSNYHKSKIKVSQWQRNDSSKWVDSENGFWELAKLFTTSNEVNFDKTDLSCLLGIVTYCKYFNVNENVLKNVKKWRNQWAHSTNQKLTESEKDEAFDAIDKFLNDSEFSTSQEVQNCRTNICDVHLTKFVSQEDIYDILKCIEHQVSQLNSKKITRKHDSSFEQSIWYHFRLQLFCEIVFSIITNFLSPLVHSKWRIAFIILFMLPLSGDEASGTTDNSCPRAREKSPLGHLKLREFNFSTYLVYKGESFFGRRWFFSELEEMFNSTYAGVLITAEPGSGKTAFMSRLICSPFSSFIHGYIIGYHFCDNALEARQDGSMFVRNLVDQIVGKLPEYRKRISEDEDIVNYLKTAKCNHYPVDCFVRSVIEPLRDIGEPFGERYIVVDALDECVTRDGTVSSILHMLSKKISYFPKWLKLILTSRTLAAITTVIPQTVKRITFDSTDERNVEDIRLYVKQYFLKNSELRSLTQDLDTLADELVNKSEGNFLVAKTTLQYLNASRDQVNVDNFPTTLYDAYNIFFQRHFSADNPFIQYRKVFEVLLATKSSLRKEELQLILNGGAQETSLIINNISPFLRVGDNGTIALYHQSLVEWLNHQSEEFAICTSQGHRLISDFLLSSNDRNINSSLRELSELCLHIIKGGNIKWHVEALGQFQNFTMAKHPSTGKCIMHILAVENNASDVLAVILGKIENVDVLDFDGKTPAFYAAAEGKSNNLKLFIDKGASINDVYRDSLSNDSIEVFLQNKGAGEFSMMHIAAFRGHVGVIKMLLDNNCFYPKNKRIPSPLQLAAGNGHFEAVRLLYSQEDARELHISLHHAAARNHSSVVQFLLDVGATDHCLPCKTENIPFLIENATVQSLHLSFCETALFAAVSRSHFEVATILLNANITAIKCKHRSGKTSLMGAVERNDTRLVELLINKGADVEEECGDKKSTPLNDELCQHYSSDVGGYLYTLYCDNDSCPCGDTAAHFAALHGFANIGVILLKRSHSSFVLKNCRGKDALRTAVSFDQANFLQRLRTTRLIDIDNSKMLYFAALCGSINVLKVFDMRLYSPLKGSKTLLHHVVLWSPCVTPLKTSFCTEDYRRDSCNINGESEKRVNFMKFLVEPHQSKNLFVNKRDENGRTALHLAAYMGFVEAVKYLVKSGAEINIEDKQGQTPLDLVIMKTPVNASEWYMLNGGDFSEYNTSCFDKTAAHLISQKGSQIKICDSRTSKLLQSVIKKIMPLSFKSLLGIGVDMQCSVDAEYRPVLVHLHIGGPMIREIFKMYEYDVSVQCNAPFRTSELHLISYSADHGQVGNFFKPSLNNKRFPLQRLLEKSPKSFYIFDECRDAEGYTAIHRATQGANVDAVNWFIEVGANAFLHSASGLTPLDLSILNLGRSQNSKEIYSILNEAVPLNSQNNVRKVFHELLFHSLKSEKHKSMLQCKNNGVDELSPLHFSAVVGEKTLDFVYYQASTLDRLPKKCANKHWIHPNYLAHFYGSIHEARMLAEENTNDLCYGNLKELHQYPDREAELHILYNHFFESPSEQENINFLESLLHFDNFDIAECPGFYDYLPWTKNTCHHVKTFCNDNVNEETGSKTMCPIHYSEFCPRVTSLTLFQPRDVCTFKRRKEEMQYLGYHCHYITELLKQWFTRKPRKNRQITDFIAERMGWSDPPEGGVVLLRWPFYFLYHKLQNKYKEYDYLKALNSALEIYHQDYGS